VLDDGVPAVGDEVIVSASYSRCREPQAEAGGVAESGHVGILMGIFNTVHADWTDPATGRTHPIQIQFFFGERWTYDYRPGDKLRWGGTDLDEGPAGAKRVIVYGIKSEGAADLPEHFEVRIENDTIVGVAPLSEALAAEMERGKDWLVLAPGANE
jgi:hypothetical protein